MNEVAGDEGVRVEATIGTASVLRPDQSFVTKPIFLSALPKDVQEQLQRNGGQDPQALIEEAIRALFDQREKGVSLTNFDLSEEKVAKEAKKLDVDGDGFLTVSEIGLGFKALHDQKVRTRQLVYLLGILLVFTAFLVGGTFGVVWMVVDIHKDMEASNGVLVSRADGQPLQVSSIDFYVEDGLLTQQAGTIPTTDLNPNTTATSPSLADNSVKTAQMTYTFESANSCMSNQMILQLKYITISSSTDANAPFIRTEVNSVVRIPDMGGPRDGSVVMMITPLGRFVLNGSNISPASADIVNMSLSELYETAIGQIVSANAGRRGGGFRTADTTCNAQNACASKLRRNVETPCCVGQVFDCEMTANTAFSCAQGYYCPDQYTSIFCGDLVFQFKPTSSKSAAGGTYRLYSLARDGNPVYINEDAGYYLTYLYTLGWSLFHLSSPPETNLAILSNYGDSNPGAGWSSSTVSVSVNGGTKYPVHCPGSTYGAMSGGVYMYYVPPYYRMCSSGFVCPFPPLQLLCDNVLLSVDPSAAIYNTALPYLGKYYLSSSLSSKGWPTWTNGAMELIWHGKPSGWSFSGAGSPMYQSRQNINPFNNNYWPSGVSVTQTGDTSVACPPQPVPNQDIINALVKLGQQVA